MYFLLNVQCKYLYLLEYYFFYLIIFLEISHLNQLLQYKLTHQIQLYYFFCNDKL